MTTGSRESHSDSGARAWFPGGCRCGRGVCWERGADAGWAQRCVLTRACRAQHADASAAAGRGGALGAEGSAGPAAGVGAAAVAGGPEARLSAGRRLSLERAVLGLLGSAGLCPGKEEEPSSLGSQGLVRSTSLSHRVDPP